ncbi:conserved exported protein of unknown function [Bradyrhizobium sp. ORS 285]|uniref:hypothetical protein n=1 Tax=Bradyrhizobium sp. ORS 285 TaxID=115808 RepID=UPI00024078B5|nr:hypothetical protein [Bradyrhizobium sp. ORS 285]CCD86185.1 conserved exported hypothetical protein [Bradyrhizobium sp. ORS 285]SMX55702.1 conserved exported protein of unknown function [Bradyrhizobium sp. ORS 285]
MYRVVLVVAALLALSVQAEARPRHHHHSSYHHHSAHHRYSYRHHSYMNAMASIPSEARVGEARVVGGRPSGCPHAFCGCEASLYTFGRVIPELNLAANWRRFPRAMPAPGMAAVRSGHVMILQQQVAGNVWLVHDGNSGGHVTREHPRSIAGYTIVNPRGGSTMFGAAAGATREARASRYQRVARNTRSDGWMASATPMAFN